MAFTANGASWTLHSTNDPQQIGHFHCDSKRQQTCVEQMFMLMLKNYFASLITGSFISYWSSSKEAAIFIFNLKAGNALATTATFLPEVFKPQTDELFVESLKDKSKKSSNFSRGILN